MRILKTLLVAATLSISATSALLAAGPSKDEGTYRIRIGGVKAGVLAFKANDNGSNYAVTGVVKSTGLIGSLVKVRYEATSRGRSSGAVLVPTRYEDVANTGRRTQSSEMDYRNGVPQVRKSDPPRNPMPFDVDPSTQKGTIDPLSAIYSLLRNVDAADACTLNVYMFDGRRRSQVSLDTPTKDGDAIICKGEYRRLKGFSDKEMAERQRFAFELTYQPIADGRFQVQRIELDTLYGKAILDRR